MPKHLYRDVSQSSSDAPPGQVAFGDLLREYRVRAGLSQEELAERAQISVNAVSALERGVRRSPHRHTLSLLAKALGLEKQDAAALGAARQSSRMQSVTADSAEHLPAHLTSFVGRTEDVAEIVNLLAKSRLVTVTGFGGIGKTRTSLEVAATLPRSIWKDVWFVDLSPLTDESLITTKIASSIQPPFTNRADTLETLTSALPKRRMLLILDNCEHIVGGVARAVDAILEACPEIAIIATSRERLNVAQEVVHRLAPLALPAKVPDPLESAYSYPAIDLFVQRARAVDQRFVVNTRNLGTIVDISRRLSGVPLAIELVAALVPVLGLPAIDKRLEQLFAVSPARRDLPSRQQTVSATIRWSYELLNAREQAFLRDMCIFSGGFTLEAAEVVCRPELVDEQSILPELSSLVNKSLIDLNDAQNGDRYMLLDSVRDFGLRELRERRELTPASRRHAHWLADLASRIESRWIESPSGPIDNLLPEIDNVRAAVAWALRAEDPDDRSLAAQISGLLLFNSHLRSAR